MHKTNNKKQDNARLGIVVSAESLRTPDTGIYRYTKAILDGLVEDGRFEVFAFDGLRVSRYQPGPQPNVSEVAQKKASNYTAPIRRHFPRAFNVLLYLVRTLLFNIQCLRNRIKLYHEPNYISLPYFGKTIITVHDLSILLYPQFHPPTRVSYIQPRLRHRVACADAVLTGTLAIKQELIEHLEIPPEKVILTPYAGFPCRIKADDIKLKEQVLADYLVEKNKYFILVGSIEPRKNLARVITAFSQISVQTRRDIKLLLVGSEQWGDKDWQDEEYEFIAYAKNVSHDNLVMLYAHAIALVFPSLYEGFGIPIIEAMECGTPVITSDRGAMKEVAGAGAILVDPLSSEEIKEAMRSILADHSLRSRLQQRAETRCRDFTWDICVDKTIQAYQSTLTTDAGNT